MAVMGSKSTIHVHSPYSLTQDHVIIEKVFAAKLNLPMEEQKKQTSSIDIKL